MLCAFSINTTNMHSILRYIKHSFVLILAFTAWLSIHAENRPFTLVIDAGHGGHDAGAVGAFSKEKNINLNVALAFGRLVESNCPDVKVIYTRRTDVFIPLQRRADIANDNKADLFISVHTNALPAGKIAYGSETYSLGMARARENLDVAKRENSVITLESNYKQTYEGFDPSKAESYVIFEIMQDRYMKQSVELARCIQSQYTKAGRPNKGVHQAGFLVLRNTSMPSVLTELGFITTPAEEKYLNSKQGIEELSRSIYNGFLNYRRSHDKSARSLPANLPSHVSAKEPHLSTTPDTVAQAKASEKVEVVPVQVTPTAELRQQDTDSNRTRQQHAAPTETTRATESRRNEPKRDATPKRESQSAKPSSKPSSTSTKTSADKKQDGKKQSSTAKADTRKPDTKKADNKKTDTKRPEAKKQGTKKPASTTSKVTYRIQVGAGKKEIAPTDPQFKGLTIKRVKEGTLYKYFYGNYTSYSAAQTGLRTAKAKISGAYIVAYVGGKSVSVAEARDKEKEKK